MNDTSIPDALRVGGWIRSHSQGIWQVTRILQDFYGLEDRRTPPRQKSDRSIFISKRLVNEAWERSFSVEGCDHLLTRSLDLESRIRLDQFIQTNPEVMVEFARYQPGVDLL